ISAESGRRLGPIAYIEIVPPSLAGTAVHDTPLVQMRSLGTYESSLGGTSGLPPPVAAPPPVTVPPPPAVPPPAAPPPCDPASRQPPRAGFSAQKFFWAASKSAQPAA